MVQGFLSGAGQWVPSHIGVRGKLGRQSGTEAHPSLLPRQTPDLTDLRNLQTHEPTLGHRADEPTVHFIGRKRQTHDTTGGPTPQPCPGHRSHQTRVGHTRLNAPPTQKMGMTDDPTAPGAPQLGTPNTSSRNSRPHSHRPGLLQSLIQSSSADNSSRPLGWVSRPGWPSKSSSTQDPSHRSWQLKDLTR
ncbi:hypothetical protein GWK47_046620 [Chionoecetes opilio]|uniref:Uncharacterized protein n=1 Tax=Chionoecetes opilio TaxID=41210 RepID=A0A8J5CX40_CHIOP|nr:hypothetical protein GWK47_046620 [Chionoecetes opilio]